MTREYIAILVCKCGGTNYAFVILLVIVNLMSKLLWLQGRLPPIAHPMCLLVSNCYYLETPFCFLSPPISSNVTKCILWCSWNLFLEISEAHFNYFLMRAPSASEEKMLKIQQGIIVSLVSWHAQYYCMLIFDGMLNVMTHWISQH